MRRNISAVIIAVLLPLVLGGWWLEAYKPPPNPSVSEASVADTVLAGRAFITQLPDSIDGLAISRYSAARLPLFSWLKDTSFVWATSEKDRGRHAIELDAHTPDTTLNAAWKIDVIVE